MSYDLEKIFKTGAYDIRGIYPKEVDEEIAFKIGQGFVKFLNETKKTKSKKGARLKIVVAQDNRISSPSLYKSLSRGIIEAGADIINIGLATTPMFYFAVAFYGFDGGVVVTSSHNPAQYNGFKLVREKAIPISGRTGLQEIKKFALSKKITVKKRGKIVKKKILRDYVKFNLKKINTKKFSSFKITIDTANSVAGILLSDIFKKTPLKISYLFKKLDGSFPNHDPNPLKKQNLKFLRKDVLKRKSDLGIAFDGDGDRIFFVTEKAEIVSGDILTALISDIILKDRPKEKIIYDVRSSNIIKETVEKRGGIPLMSGVGHSFIKEKMRKENALFAGELSGHYYSRDHFFYECPFSVLFLILKEMTETKKTLSQMVKPFKKYYHSGEINFRVEDKKKILSKIDKKFGKKGKVSRIDGLKIEFSDWWLSLRVSNTEPFLRLIIEAKTKKILDKNKKKVIALIKKG